MRLDCDTKYIIAANVDAVVNFLSQVIFVFVLFLGMVMYASEVETKEKQKRREIKNELQHRHYLTFQVALLGPGLIVSPSMVEQVDIDLAAKLASWK